MSDKQNQEHQQEMARRRLLKANNVQRRRFEKMVDMLGGKAKRKISQDHQDEKRVLKEAIMLKHAGEEFEALVEIRNRILKLKEDIQHYVDKADVIAKKMDKKGIILGMYDLRYYTSPTNSDDNAYCKNAGNPNVQGYILACRDNPVFVEYEAKTLYMDAESEELDLELEELRADVWHLVTTDEIRESITNFKERWNV